MYSPVMRLRSPRARGFPAHCRSAFTLVEVVLALGVAVFAMLPILALMPIGLQTLQDASNDTITATIAQEIRGELQQVSFNTPVVTGTPTELSVLLLCGTAVNGFPTLDNPSNPINSPSLFASGTAPGAIYYYTIAGVKLNNDLNYPALTSPPSNAYYRAIFTHQTFANPYLSATFNSTASANPTAEMITVYLQYPVTIGISGTASYQHTQVFSLLAAKQNSD